MCIVSLIEGVTLISMMVFSIEKSKSCFIIGVVAFTENYFF